MNEEKKNFDLEQRLIDFKLIFPQMRDKKALGQQRKIIK